MLLTLLGGIAVASLYAIASRLWIAVPNSSYCYESVTSLSEKHHQVNCFEVSSSGCFAKVFSYNEAKDKNLLLREGHVIPGLWDGHGHLLQYGEFLHSVDLFGASSLEETRSRVVEYVSEHPLAGSSSEWIRGVGWDQAAFGRMPTAADLDVEKLLRDKYIMLDRVDVHCVWVSQAVLNLLPNPLPVIPGGEIITDPGKGVFCDNAMNLIMQRWPRPNRGKKMEFITSAIKKLHEVGLVGIHDAGVVPSNLDLFQEMADREAWSMRVYAMFECERRNTFCPEEAAQYISNDGMLQVQSVKLFADGALGSWGSAMLSPYSDRPSTNGSLLVNATTLTSLTQSWAAAGYQVNIHAIGDLANRLAIDAFENTYESICPGETAAQCQSKRRFRIEHAQIIHPDDQKRMFNMDIIPSIQPTHATSDMYYAEDRLGHERTVNEAYRMRSLLPLNLVLGSDFPVEPPNPFDGMFAAVTRRSPKTGLDRDGTNNGWYAEETLTLKEALIGFTLGPARGAFLEGTAGVIQEGAFADWIVLDKHLPSMDIEDVRALRVKETWVAGKLVYQRDDIKAKDELK